jgi:2'-5' RNA ligase
MRAVESVRTFVAVPVPPEVAEAASAAGRARLDAISKIRWIERGSVHVTLKFLGEVAAGALERLSADLAAVARAHGPFDLEVAGLGAFPERGPVRVIWAGCSGATARLADLARDVEGVAARIGIPAERRPFAPHLTIGRTRSPKGSERIRAALAGASREVFGTLPVHEIVLYRSDLSPQGAQYTPLGRWRLGG